MNICKTCLSRFGCNPNFENGGNDFCTMYVADKNAIPKQIDWEQRRYEIAKDIVIKYLEGTGMAFEKSLPIDNALEIADKLIERLKKK